MGSGAVLAASPQYEILKDTKPQRLGLMSGFSWEEDPKRFAFTASRYKFVAKMFEGKGAVLEVGSSDGFFSRIVRQSVASLMLVDINAAYVASANDLARETKWDMRAVQMDFMTRLPVGDFEAAYSLDLYEHLEDGERFLERMSKCAPLVIVGAPSAESQRYASAVSLAEHVNCPSKGVFRAAMQRHFSQVLMFGQNDEVVHTGYGPMCQYLIAVGVNA